MQRGKRQSHMRLRTATPDGISGLLPHYAIATLNNGRWAGFHVTTEGFERITAAYGTPVEAAKEVVLVLMELHGGAEQKSGRR